MEVFGMAPLTNENPNATITPTMLSPVNVMEKRLQV